MKKVVDIKKFVKAITFVSILIALALVINNLYAQKKNKDDPPKNNDNQPNVSIKVDKQTDKNGKVTRYDSTYCWSWTNKGKISQNMDSLMKSMHERFFKGFPYEDSSFGFKNDIFNDSSFFSNNFEGWFGKDFGNFDNMLAEQEKMMKKFFNQEPKLKIPEGVTPPAPPKKPEKKEKKEKPLIQDNHNTDL